MNQIKNIIKKKIILYCELNDIHINPELKKKYIENVQTGKKVTFDNEGELKLKSSKNKEKLKSTIKTIIPEVDESQFITNLKNSSISKINSYRKSFQRQ